MTSLIELQRRRWLRHGFIFLFVAALLGIATAILPHPRAWRAAHLTAFLTCLVLVAIGLVWRELHLTERQRSIGLITGFTSAYLGLAANIFSAIPDEAAPPPPRLSANVGPTSMTDRPAAYFLPGALRIRSTDSWK
jgi:hypothetical protein